MLNIYTFKPRVLQTVTVLDVLDNIQTTNYFRAFITFNLKSKCNRNTIPQIFPVDCAS